MEQVKNKYLENVNHSSIHQHIPFCVNCGISGHCFKACEEAVCSYGLLCFYKKKILVKDSVIVNDIFNKKTKKNSNSLKSNTSNKLNSINTHNKYNTNRISSIANFASISKIKILKRHETISHTLKNMLGIVGGDTDENGDNILTEVDGLRDFFNPSKNIEEIIDMDGEYDIPEIQSSIEIISTSNTSNTSPTTPIVSSPMKEIIVDKVLMVQRRNTIGMIEFVRGKYDSECSEYIVKLFNMMTFDEKRLLREYDSFDMIRTLIGLKREHNYKNEYDEAKRKFIYLKQNPLGDQVHCLLDKSYTKWTSPEWGVPKGRRNHKEFDVECAIREFVEETGIKYKNINVYKNIKPLEELYTGINGIVYKHIYYFADIKDTNEAHDNVIFVEKGGFHNNEVSSVKLFSLAESHKLIRPYYVSKLNVIKKGFHIVNSLNIFFE